MLMETELSHQIAYAATFCYVMQRLKLASWFTWIRKNNALVNRIVSISVAFITAAGFTWTYHGTFIAGGILTIGIPSAAQLHEFLIHFASSMTLQESIYRSAAIHIQIPEEAPIPVPAIIVGVDEYKVKI